MWALYFNLFFGTKRLIHQLWNSRDPLLCVHSRMESKRSCFRACESEISCDFVARLEEPNCFTASPVVSTSKGEFLFAFTCGTGIGKVGWGSQQMIAVRRLQYEKRNTVQIQVPLYLTSSQFPATQQLSSPGWPGLDGSWIDLLGHPTFSVHALWRQLKLDKDDRRTKD